LLAARTPTDAAQEVHSLTEYWHRFEVDCVVAWWQIVRRANP